MKDPVNYHPQIPYTRMFVKDETQKIKKYILCITMCIDWLVTALQLAGQLCRTCDIFNDLQGVFFFGL